MPEFQPLCHQHETIAYAFVDFSAEMLQSIRSCGSNLAKKREVFMVDKDMIIVDVLRLDINSAGIFMEEGLHCLGCVMSSGETIEQACQVHGLNPDHLIARLNEYFGEE